MRITRDNNYWIVTNNVQSSQIKSIKMYSLFSENSTNEDPYSPVTFQNTPFKPNTILKYFFQVLRRGSGFDEIFCIFANMSCLCIHLVTLFNLPCKKKFVMEFFFLCRKISFFHHPKVFISVK